MTDNKGVIGDLAAKSAQSSRSLLAPPLVDTGAVRPEADLPTPDLRRTEDAVASAQGRSMSLAIIAVLATFYTMYFARAFLVPIIFAVLLNFLLSPALRLLARIRIPPPLGAAFIVLILLGALSTGVYALAEPAQSLANSAPQTLAKANRKLRTLFLARVQRATSQVERAAVTLDDPSTGRAPREVVVSATPTIGSRILGTTQVLVAAVLEIVILLYFLLAGGDLFLQKFIKVLPQTGDKHKAIAIARETEAAVSAYLFTTLLVNVSEGAVVALALWGLGMPNPVLWAVLIAALEFIPYLGALTGVVVLGLAALTTFDNPAHALLVPGSFLAINLIQANLVTPMLLGHRLTLNPVAIFVGLTFFFWIWGVAGAFLAVPLVATLKIFCDNIRSLAAIGEFLGERDDVERRAMVRVSIA
ncbi:MAG TPA: AI-2E family transporter [Gemmatimonadaceae bacterium]|jgi:predicted PurR-regulated permease PerM